MSAVTQNEDVDLVELIREHQAGIWRYLRFIGASTSEAEDLVQETFLALLRANFTYKGPAATTAYLRQVARNQLLQARRREGREVNTVALAAAEAVWAEVAAEDGLSDYVSAMRECLQPLRDRSRQVIELHYGRALGRAEIANFMGMKPDGIKTLLRRTRQLLRDCVERKVKS